MSTSGRATAIEYGLEVLRSNQRPSKSQFQDIMDANGLVYLGDRFVNVIIEENGYIYDVDVTWQSSVPSPISSSAPSESLRSSSIP